MNAVLTQGGHDIGYFTGHESIRSLVPPVAKALSVNPDHVVIASDGTVRVNGHDRAYLTIDYARYRPET